MNRQEIFYVLALLATITGWFYLRLGQIKTYEEYYPEFYNATTNKWIKPKDYMAPIDLNPVETRSLINDTSSRERLLIYARTWRLMNIIKFKQRYDREQDVEMSSWPVANKQLCRKQLQYIAKQVRSVGATNMTLRRGIWALNLNTYMESFGQPEYGLYDDRLHWLGSQLACESVTLDGLSGSGGGVLKHRYCIGHARFSEWPNHVIWGATINIGLCLPKTCDSRMFQQNREEIEFLAKFNWAKREKDSIVLDEMFCLPDEESPIRQIPWQGRLLLYVLAAWSTLMIISSIAYEYFVEPMKEADMINKNHLTLYWRVFTIQYGIERLGSTARTQRAVVSNSQSEKKIRNVVDMRALDFLKSMMAILVVFGHSILMTIFYARPTAENWFGELIRLSFSLGRLNDTFFIIFGTLMATKILGNLEARRNLGRPCSWLGIYWQIIWRVFPLFFISYWINRSVTPYLSSGPWWDYALGNSFRSICATEPWWKSIPYVGDWGVQAIPHCNIPSWFIIAYVQLGFVCPLMVYVIDRLPNYASRLCLVVFTFLISLMHTGIKLANQNVYDHAATVPFGFFTVLFVDKYEPSGYFDSLGRLGCVSIGCLLGKFLHQYKTGDNQVGSSVKGANLQHQLVAKPKFEWPSWLTDSKTLTLCILGHLLIGLLPSIAHHLDKITGKPADFYTVLALNTAGLFAWPVVNSIFMINIMTRWRDVDWVRFMSHPVWRCFNELGLGICLFHFEAIIVANTSNETANSHDFIFDIVSNFTFSLTITILGAILAYVFVQAPIDGLSKLQTTPRKALYYLFDLIKGTRNLDGVKKSSRIKVYQKTFQKKSE